MAAVCHAVACIYLVGFLQGLNALATKDDPILDRLARLKRNFAHMHHRHREAPPPQEDASSDEESAPAPQMSFSQGPMQPVPPMQQAPHLDLSVLGAPPQPMMQEMQRSTDNFAPPPLSMGQMSAPQNFGPPPQAGFEAPQPNFAPPAPQDEAGSAPPMDEEHHDDDNDNDSGNARDDRSAKSDPIVQRLALLKNNFAKMHHKHRSSQNMDVQSSQQNEQAPSANNPSEFQQPLDQNAPVGEFQQPLDQNAPGGLSRYQPKPTHTALMDAPPSALDMSTPSYGSQTPLAYRKPVFGLKLPDADPPPEDDPPADAAPQGGVQGSFQQTDDDQSGPPGDEDSEDPEPVPQAQHGSYDRQNDPIIARLSRFRDNIESLRSAKTLNEGRAVSGRNAQLQTEQSTEQSDDEIAQQHGMEAFNSFQPDTSAAAPDPSALQPDTQRIQQEFQQDSSYQRGRSMNSDFQPRAPASAGRSSMSAAEVIAKLQTEGNAQLQAEFHQSQYGGYEPNTLPGVQPDPQAQSEDRMAEPPAMHSDGMGAEDMGREEAPPMRSRRRMNLWQQQQQQDQGAPASQQFPQHPSAAMMQQRSEFLEQQSGDQEPPMQKQWSSNPQQDGQTALNQVQEQDEQTPQGQPDSDQNWQQPADQGSTDSDGSRQDDTDEERPAASGQRDDPIVDRLGMLQNNFKRIRDNAHGRTSESREDNMESGQELPVVHHDSFAQQSESDDAGADSPPPPSEGPQPEYQGNDEASDDQNSEPQQSAPPMEANEDQTAMPPGAMTAPHRWSLLQGQSTAGQGAQLNTALSSHSVLPNYQGQFTKGQSTVDPDVAATDKSIDAQVAEAESVGPSSTITDLISKHSHHHIDEKLAMIQENFEKMHLRKDR